MKPPDDPFAGLDAWIPEAPERAVAISSLQVKVRATSDSPLDAEKAKQLEKVINASVAEMVEAYRAQSAAMAKAFYPDGPMVPSYPPPPWHRRLRWRLDAALDRALRWFGLARISRPPPEWDRDE